MQHKPKSPPKKSASRRVSTTASTKRQTIQTKSTTPSTTRTTRSADELVETPAPTKRQTIQTKSKAQPKPSQYAYAPADVPYAGQTLKRCTLVRGKELRPSYLFKFDHSIVDGGAIDFNGKSNLLPAHNML